MVVAVFADRFEDVAGRQVEYFLDDPEDGEDDQDEDRDGQQDGGIYCLTVEPRHIRSPDENCKNIVPGGERKVKKGDGRG
jgi:hypothetical protein